MFSDFPQLEIVVSENVHPRNYTLEIIHHKPKPLIWLWPNCVS